MRAPLSTCKSASQEKQHRTNSASCNESEDCSAFGEVLLIEETFSQSRTTYRPSTAKNNIQSLLQWAQTQTPMNENDVEANAHTGGRCPETPFGLALVRNSSKEDDGDPSVHRRERLNRKRPYMRTLSQNTENERRRPKRS